MKPAGMARTSTVISFASDWLGVTSGFAGSK